MKLVTYDGTNGFFSKLRMDRTGAKFYKLISDLLYCFAHDKKLFIDRKIESSILQPLFEKAELLTDEIDETKLVRLDGVRTTAYKLSHDIKLDLITYSKQNLDLKAKEPSQIDFKTGQIVIHVRNGDVVNRPIHDGLKCHEYCKQMVEDGVTYNRNFMYKTCGPDDQCPTSESALDKVLSEVCLKYPEKEVHLVSETKSVSLERYKNISKKYNIKFFESDISTDFYHLATADVLIGSRSTYCITALYHFTGKEFFYPHWGPYACLGLGTKYDQTNYKSFRNI